MNPISQIKAELTELTKEKDGLEEEIIEALEIVTINRKRIAAIEGRLYDLREAASAAMNGDKYSLHIAGY